ncbi:MAG: OstA-like protein [Balneolaceae bacterium]|nr:OstA-like protein [Balneolaceae bacterium]
MNNPNPALPGWIRIPLIQKMDRRCGSIVIAVFLLSFAWPLTAVAQSEFLIRDAKFLRNITVDNEQIRYGVGNVHLVSDQAEVFCDSVYRFLDKNEIRAYGNIEVRTEQERIWTDTLVYFSDVDFSQLRGRVIIETDTMILFSNSVDYRFTTRVGHIIDRVRLEDQEGVLTARSGYYYREPDSAVFRGNVQLADTLQYAEGDSIFVNRRKESYEIHGDVFIDDREERVKLKGDYLEADSTGRRLLEGNAWMQRFEADSARTDSTESDTTHIWSNRILSTRDIVDADTNNIVNAYGNVRIWSSEFAAIADTARFESLTETFELWSDPIAWHQQIQLTGPYIRVRLKDEQIERLTSYPTPFAVQHDTTIDRLNQMTGDTLIARFNEGEISHIHLYNNSHLIRYTENENGQSDGAVELVAPSTRIFFKEGKLEELKSTGPVDGSYLPESEQTKEKRIDGFSWNPNLRPRKPAEKMNPRFMPIPDTLWFELPRRFVQSRSETPER